MKEEKNKKGIRVGRLLILLVLVLGVVLFYLFLIGIHLPNPPRPEITYAEFPFRIELEHNGERIVFEDTLICEFRGFGTSGVPGERRRVRSWRSRLESGIEYNTTWPSITLLETDYVVVRFHSGEPAFYMDLSSRELEHGIPWMLTRPSIWVDDLEKRAGGEWSFSRYGVLSPESQERLSDTLANFEIKLISIEITPPIENTFR